VSAPAAGAGGAGEDVAGAGAERAGDAEGGFAPAAPIEASISLGSDGAQPFSAAFQSKYAH
jgi:hypothetical protein